MDLDQPPHDIPTTGSTVVLPGSTDGLPATGSAVVRPAATGFAVVWPAATGFATVGPVATGSAAVGPGATGSAAVRPAGTALASGRGPSSGSIAKGRPPKPQLKKTTPSRLTNTGAPAPTTPEASVDGGVRLLKSMGFGSKLATPIS
jgi:hypothetical protein